MFKKLLFLIISIANINLINAIIPAKQQPKKVVAKKQIAQKVTINKPSPQKVTSSSKLVSATQAKPAVSTQLQQTPISQITKPQTLTPSLQTGANISSIPSTQSNQATLVSTAPTQASCAAGANCKPPAAACLNPKPVTSINDCFGCGVHIGIGYIGNNYNTTFQCVPFGDKLDNYADWNVVGPPPTPDISIILTCPQGQQLQSDGKSCCISPKTLINGQCNCPNNQILDQNNQCQTCPAGQGTLDGKTCIKCPEGQNVVNNKCVQPDELSAIPLPESPIIWTSQVYDQEVIGVSPLISVN